MTEAAVRKRKRVVMLVPGLVAFGMYRMVKQVNPLADALMLLGVSGFISALTALVAYRVGRRATFGQIWEEDGGGRVAWVGGWIGFIYGLQLSLMVLALLKVVVNYDFLRHPDGPAMMAIIIACTSVARDAFEIGHVRWLGVTGRRALTFPDGKPLRTLAFEEPASLARWLIGGGGLCAAVAFGLSVFCDGTPGPLIQLLATTVVAGTLALWAYLVGVQHREGFTVSLDALRWGDLFRFWWWPGLAFAATYYLVAAGVVAYFFQVPLENLKGGGQAAIGGCVGAVMAIYGYYLGVRRYSEDLVEMAVPPSLLRCPFVMGILRRSGGRLNPDSMAGHRIALHESGPQG